MLNIDTPDLGNIINCVVPIEIENLRKYFENKDLSFHIDYSCSKLQDKKLLVYLSNLDVPADLTFSKALDFEKRSSLLYEYMTLPAVVNLPVFNLAASSIVFRYKGYDIENAYPNPYFSLSEVDLYIRQNTSTVSRWVTFLDSCTIYAQKCLPELNDEKFLTDGIEIVTNREYVGYSIVNLFSLDFFFHNYYQKPLGTLYYFKPQFEEYMFHGKNLFYYYATKHNFLLSMLKALGKDYADAH